MRSHSVIEARLKFSPRESRLEVRQKNTLLLLISTFSGPPCGEYRDDGSLSMIRIPHGRMIAATRTYRAYNTRTHAHTFVVQAGEGTRHYKVACHGSMDLASGQSRGLLHFLAPRNFLLVPFVRSRASTESGGALDRIYRRPIGSFALVVLSGWMKFEKQPPVIAAEHDLLIEDNYLRS